MCAASGGPVRFITVTVYAMVLSVSSYSKVAGPPAPGNVPLGDGRSCAASSVASSVTFGSSWAACPTDTNDNENASTIGAARCRITAPPVGLGSLPAFEPSRAGDPRERRAHGDRQRVPGEQVEPLVDGARDPHRRRGEEEGRGARIGPRERRVEWGAAVQGQEEGNPRERREGQDAGETLSAARHEAPDGTYGRRRLERH